MGKVNWQRLIYVALGIFCTAFAGFTVSAIYGFGSGMRLFGSMAAVTFLAGMYAAIMRDQR